MLAWLDCNFNHNLRAIYHIHHHHHHGLENSHHGYQSYRQALYLPHRFPNHLPMWVPPPPGSPVSRRQLRISVLMHQDHRTLNSQLHLRRIPYNEATTRKQNTELLSWSPTLIVPTRSPPHSLPNVPELAMLPPPAMQPPPPRTRRTFRNHDWIQ